MGFVVENCGPGKRDPWKKGLRARKKGGLWPPSFWDSLCDEAKRHPGEKFSEACVRMISEMNQRLYGAA